MRRPMPLSPPPAHESAMAPARGCNTTPMASSRMVDALMRWSRIHTAASRRSVRIFAYVMASSG
jgi:hypothetical protein